MCGLPISIFFLGVAAGGMLGGHPEVEGQEGGGGVRKFRRCTLHKATIKFGIAAKCSSKKAGAGEGRGQGSVGRWKAEVRTRRERGEAIRKNNPHLDARVKFRFDLFFLPS